MQLSTQTQTLFAALPVASGLILSFVEPARGWPIHSTRREVPRWLPWLVLLVLAVSSITMALMYPDLLEPAEI